MGRKNQILPDLSNKRVVWMHCSSLGEFEQGRPVFEKLKTKLNNHTFVLSFFSPSGYEFISKKDKDIANYILYLPLDKTENARQFIKKINPELAIFVKYDFWYNYILELNTRQIPLIYISVLLKNNSNLFSFYFKPLLNQLKKINKIFTQDESTTQLLNSKGFINAETAGDTRIDRVISIASNDYKDSVIENFIDTNKPTIILGSTWHQDIKVISYTNDFLINNYNVIIAPHELSPKELKIIEEEFSNYKIAYYSAPDNINSANLLIIDKIGILKNIYRYANIAYIGGGFGVGIHNTLEPGAYGIPVIFGPKYEKFIEAVNLINKQAYFKISDGKQFKLVLERLDDKNFYIQASNKIKNYFEDNKNISDKIVNYIIDNGK
ncbi:MAG: glycosyltransferase N-terminal domain-containing protein [Saprospiraceae bacterium]